MDGLLRGVPAVRPRPSLWFVTEKRDSRAPLKPLAYDDFATLTSSAPSSRYPTFFTVVSQARSPGSFRRSR